MKYKYNEQGIITEPAKNRTIPVNSWRYRDEVQPWIDAGNTIEPYQTAEEAAAENLEQGLAAITADTDSKLATFEVSYNGETFDFHTRSKDNFLGRITLCYLGVIPNVPWRPKGSRVDTVYSLEDAKGIAGQIAAYMSQVDQEGQTAKTALEQS
jgi:hypothetical protein